MDKAAATTATTSDQSDQHIQDVVAPLSFKNHTTCQELHWIFTEPETLKSETTAAVSPQTH